MLHRARHQIFALILICPALVLSACSSADPRNASTAMPVPGETQASTAPRLLFEDDFDDSSSGWLEAADAESGQGYRDGRFFFEIRSPDLIAWDTAGGNFKDFALQVEARQVSGAVENSYGLLFRYIDDNNFYRFDLTGDSHYAVFKLEYGEWITLVDWQASEYIKPQGETNLIKIVCRGSKMSFFVGHQELDSLEDSSFERGDVGLFATTFADANIEAEFDHLQIWQAGDG